MSEETEKPEQAETTDTTDEAQQVPMRTLVIRTDGARMEIPFCTMGLWEMKAILEETLGITKQKLAQVAQAGQAPQAPPAETAETAEAVKAEEPESGAVDSE